MSDNMEFIIEKLNSCRAEEYAWLSDADKRRSELVDQANRLAAEANKLITEMRITRNRIKKYDRCLEILGNSHSPDSNSAEEANSAEEGRQLYLDELMKEGGHSQWRVSAE